MLCCGTVHVRYKFCYSVKAVHHKRKKRGYPPVRTPVYNVNACVSIGLVKTDIKKKYDITVRKTYVIHCTEWHHVRACIA
jgi:hypothetical protein